MAEEANNPYARLYGKPSHTMHNSTTAASQPNLYSPSQPRYQHSAQQPRHSQLQPQPASGPRSSGHAQHVPPACDSMTHLPAGSSAPPWQSAAPAQHGLPADDSFAHLSRKVQAHPGLEAGAPHQPLSLQQMHAAHLTSGNSHITHSKLATPITHHSAGALGQSNTYSVGQTQGGRRTDRAAEELSNKRQRVSTHSNDSPNCSSMNDAATHQAPKADAAGEQGVNGEGGHGKTVLIWDVDETLVLFLSLLDGSFARAFCMPDPMMAVKLGERWQDAIMDLCDDELLFTQLEAADQTTLTSLLAHDDGLPLDELSLPDHPVSLPLDSVSRRQMAHAYRLIRHKYSKGLAKLSEKEVWLETVASLRQLVSETDAMSGGWLSHARQLLHQTQDLEPRVHHVLVTTGQLIPTLAKLLICGLDAYVPPDSIYSARNESKDTCFGLIEDTYGPFAKYCAIGDGPEEKRCAETRVWPFVQVILSPCGPDNATGRRLTDITAEDVLVSAQKCCSASALQ